MVFKEGLTIVDDTLLGQHLFEKVVQRQVFGHHFRQYRQQDFNGNGIEIIMDVKFVGPHFLISDGSYDVKNGIAGFHAPAEGVAVRREPFIVVIEFEGKKFEDDHLFGSETVNHPFLARSHLIDNFLLGNA